MVSKSTKLNKASSSAKGSKPAKENRVFKDYVFEEADAQRIVGKKVRIYWPLDAAWYEGVVKAYDCKKKRHSVTYDDGDKETLNFHNEKIRVLYVEDEILGQGKKDTGEKRKHDSDKEYDNRKKKKRKEDGDDSDRKENIVAEEDIEEQKGEKHAEEDQGLQKQLEVDEKAEKGHQTYKRVGKKNAENRINEEKVNNFGANGSCKSSTKNTKSDDSGENVETSEDPAVSIKEVALEGAVNLMKADGNSATFAVEVGSVKHGIGDNVAVDCSLGIKSEEQRKNGGDLEKNDSNVAVKHIEPKDPPEILKNKGKKQVQTDEQVDGNDSGAISEAHIERIEDKGNNQKTGESKGSEMKSSLSSSKNEVKNKGQERFKHLLIAAEAIMVDHSLIGREKV
eukprot:TRINITY_DN3931_c0_g1_i1.p1 TRINITY_DN3931_c0_g1~~TRINITY_DN3931_c0_g1_i1.p1  ORF type:complete len:395 (-),score=119.35 TRINITY_DN3931_c0_g1_i1:153-1337(-)